VLSLILLLPVFKTRKKKKELVMQIRSVIFDVDGTLIDSNDAHAHSWVAAMADQGYQVPFEKIRPLIGMGGDKVLPAVLGIEKDSVQGKKISERRKEIFKTQYLSTLHAFPHTKELLQHLHERGLKLVIATSAEPDELKELLQIIDEHAYTFFSQQSSAKDAKKSKPDADVMRVALERSGYDPAEVIMIGDTRYDIEASAKVGIKTLAFRCGGWSDEDLAEAIAIYDDPANLLANYEYSPLASVSSH
jgi:HAD superfamily hydrolase (TIGR01549 family)